MTTAGMDSVDFEIAFQVRLSQIADRAHYVVSLWLVKSLN